MQTTTLTARPKKLRSGDWGAIIDTTDVREGDTVTIRTKAGKTWQAQVSKVIWTGSGVSILATESIDRPHRTSRPTPTRGCDRCGCTDPSCGATGLCRGPSFDPCFDCV